METYANMYHEESTVVNIDDVTDSYVSTHPKIETDAYAEEFYQTIADVANQNQLEIRRYSYDIYQNLFHPTTAIYTNAKEGGCLFNKVQLKSGRYMENEEEFLSSIQTNDPHQSGRIKQFNASHITEIHPFTAQKDLPFAFACELNTTDKQTVQKFTDALHAAGIKTEGEGSITDDTFGVDPDIVALGLLLTASVYVLFILSLLYYLTSRYKAFAVYKLFGDENRRLLRKILQKCLILFALGEAIGFAVMTLGLYLYNQLSYYLSFLLLWAGVQIAIVFLSVLLVLFLSYLLIKRMRVSQMLNNKKPAKSNKLLNYITKFIFSVVIIGVFISGAQNMIYLIQSNKNAGRWQETTQFAYIYNVGQVKILENGAVDQQEQLEQAKALKRLFVLTNNRGGVFIAPSRNEYLIPPASPEEAATQNQIPEYDPYRKSVEVNNHYLKRNPILDVNGKAVDLPDEETPIITLLVPEKYRDCEAEILRLYAENITFHTYELEDNCLHLARGTNSQNDPIPHEPPKIKIIYVKNNQHYFTYNPNCCKETNNELIDPIAIVKNNSSFNYDDCLDKMASGCYFAIVDDMNHPKDSLLPLIREANAESIAFVESVYKQIDKNMYDMKMQFILQAAVMVVSFSVLIVLILTLTANYIEEHMAQIAVKKLHGFSFFKRYAKYFISIPLFWAVVSLAIGLVGMQRFLIDIRTILLFSACVMIVDIVLSFLMLKRKENVNIKDVLKGG